MKTSTFVDAHTSAVFTHATATSQKMNWHKQKWSSV